MNDLVSGFLVAAMGALGLCAVLPWVFVTLYARLPWRRTAEGRHLMRMTTIMGVMFTASFVLNIAPLPPLWQAIVALVVFSAMAFELWARVALLLRAQRERDGQQ